MFRWPDARKRSTSTRSPKIKMIPPKPASFRAVTEFFNSGETEQPYKSIHQMAANVPFADNYQSMRVEHG